MSRKVAREKAMQAIFQVNLAEVEIKKALEDVLEDSGLEGVSKDYATEISLGTYEKLAEIDELIKKSALKWQMERIGNVEKAVLRVAVYEIVFVDDVPDAVAINEALELVKIFSTEKAVPFVNAILDKIAKEARG